MNPLVSVIVPVYNVENYLEKCVKSICKQTYEKLEIILVNDGSNDNSFALCNALKDDDSRIKVIDKENGGLSDARNFGIHAAQGAFYVFIDSDDFITDQMIEKMVAAIIDNDADIAVCDMEYLYENGHKVFASGGDFTCDSVKNNEKLILINNSACNKVFKKELFNDVLFPVGKYYEDLFTIPILIFKADKVVKINEVFYTYFQRSGSIAHTANKKIFDIYDAIKHCIDYVKEQGSQSKVLRELNHMYIIHGLDLTTLRIKDFDDKNICIEYLEENMEMLKKHYPTYEEDEAYKTVSFKKKLIFKLMKMKKMKMVLKLYGK